MGNTQQNSHGSMYIETARPFYSGGDTLTGTIHMNLLKPYNANQLYLYIKGSEDTKWYERVKVYNHKTKEWTKKTKKRTASYGLIHFKVPIYNWEKSRVYPGQYSFPFSFTLPTHLPGSFSYTSRLNDASGDITYCLEGSLETNLPGAHAALTSRHQLKIRQKVDATAFKNNISTADQRSFYNFGLFSQGTCSLKCKFDKNAYTSFDKATVNVEVYNTANRLDIKEINIKLVQDIMLTNNYGKRQIRNTVDSAKIAGVKSGKNSPTGGFSLQLPLKNYSEQTTTNGHSIWCSYRLVVTAKPKGLFCWSKQPSCELPLIVFPSEFKAEVGMVQAPQDWQPQVFPENNFELREDFMYTPEVPGARGEDDGEEEEPRGSGAVGRDVSYHYEYDNQPGDPGNPYSESNARANGANADYQYYDHDRMGEEEEVKSNEVIKPRSSMTYQ
eukprot:CAMPEP_0114982876 /NCGR_PEP_ID=MMETSP0216-20121206/6380_1 /TAXON_ID=223996 /ORGANISM="Protocruzia adherens, Strain Boccale" /LENGTH=442 /DNA_ID=CAMNT_0002344781 /DNA_START=126 /DNA_END=1454 /DNA_ORIENTATION=-